MLFAGDPQPLFQLFTARAADIELRSILESQRVVAARTVEQRVDAIEPDDRRTMNAEEGCRIELLLQRLHALTDGVGLVAGVQFGVGTARGDVVDPGHGNDADLSARFDRDPLAILSLPRHGAKT